MKETEERYWFPFFVYPRQRFLVRRHLDRLGTHATHRHHQLRDLVFEVEGLTVTGHLKRSETR